eukprot:SAG11_NODE_29883_length_306_cov_0.748792_1_plen_32_part_01
MRTQIRVIAVRQFLEMLFEALQVRHAPIHVLQ